MRLSWVAATTHISLARPVDSTTGPDGNRWFTEQDANTIGRRTTAGAKCRRSGGFAAWAGARGGTHTNM